MWLELLAVLIVCSITFYRWATANNDFFQQRQIPFDKPKFLIGSGADVVTGKKCLFQSVCDLYNQHDGIVYGIFESRKPLYLIRDPELVKHILIKDFDHFGNRQSFFGEDNKNLFSNSLFLLQNDKWRDMRNTLTPAFTGSKLRQMFQLILPTVQEAMVYVKEILQPGKEVFELDVKDFTSRLTSDIIASMAFGLQVNSFRDRDNEFYTKAKQSVNFTTLQQLKMMFMFIMPKVTELLQIDVLDKKYVDYFMRLVLDTMSYRMENQIHRPDMINLLMEARGMIPSLTPETHFREWTDDEMVAQCFAFFMAGFDTTAGFMSFAAHELMEYPEVQQKLYEEIQTVNEKLEGNPVTYEILQTLPYLEMVVSEVLRKWPQSEYTDRKCTKDFVYESAEGQRLEIKKGEFVRIPVCGLQRDPKYYKDPDVFKPERFSAKNKMNIVGGTYLPFGLGPRNCIGHRFAVLEGKAFLYYLIRDYRLEVAEKTCLSLELGAGNVNMKPKNGFWLQLRPRSSS